MMCKGRRYLRLSLDADQIDYLNAFLERVKEYDCYNRTNKKSIEDTLIHDDRTGWVFVVRPIREMASYWQGVFQMAIEQSTYTTEALLKGDS